MVSSSVGLCFYHMACAVFGPGLVGTYLGAAAMAVEAVPGASQRCAAERVLLPVGERTGERTGERIWRPRLVAQSHLPLLVTTRCHQTPWTTLPPAALVVQNGLGQPRPVVTAFMALDVIDGVLTALGPAPRLVVMRQMPLMQQWQPVLRAWRDAGLLVEEVADPRPAQWEKAILNATVGPLTLTRSGSAATMAAVWADPITRALVLAATEEGLAIAHAEGIRLTAGVVERASALFSAIGDHVPSCRRDPGELPHIHGPLLAAAARHRLAAPVLTAIAHGAC